MRKLYLKRKKDDSIREIFSPKDGCWIRVVEPDEEDIDFLSENLGIPQEFMTDSLDPNERPRIDKENGKVLLVVRIPFEEENAIKTIPLGIIITKNYILTICSKQETITQPFIENKIKGFYTTQRARFVLYIFREINKWFGKYLDEIEGKISVIEKMAVRSLSNKEILELINYQRTLLYFSISISMNEKVFRRIAEGGIFKLYKEDEDLLEDLVLLSEEILDNIKIFGKILSAMSNAYSSIVSNNLNIVMKTLTSITIILSIPTILFSAYGMNLLLPLQRHPLAFWIVWIVSFIWMFLMAVVFRKIKWM